jgi:plastocyanin
MIFRWPIFFKVLFLLSASSLPGFGAAVSGKVVLKDSRVDEVRKKGDFSGVVIYLQPSEPVADLPRARRFRMLQKDKTFTPHILPIPVGSTVDFPNADPIFHSAFSSYNGQLFDVGLYPPGTNRAVHFTRPGVVRVFCNIHPTMSAAIVVLSTPWFATTGRNGAFRIEAPLGEYDLKVFHERATDTTLDSLTRQISVTEGGTDLPAIEISESGYVVAGHKNKFGKDYPPGSGDELVYPGARK